MAKDSSDVLAARAMRNAVGLMIFAVAVLGWGVAKDFHWTGTSEACGWLAVILFFGWCLS